MNRLKLRLAISLASIFAIGTWALAQSNVSGPRETMKPIGFAAASGDLIALTITNDGGMERLVLIDAKVKSVAIYGISEGESELQLLSSRKVADDFLLDVYRGKGLLPKDIRQALERQLK